MGVSHMGDTPESAAAATTREWVDRVHSLLGLHATEGNSIEVLRNGDEIFASMLDAINNAERTVDIVTFVFWTGHVADRFARALAGAANRGCRVRVLIDALAERKLDAGLVSVMKGAGCDVRWFRPFTDEKIPQLNGANNTRIARSSSSMAAPVSSAVSGSPTNGRVTLRTRTSTATHIFVSGALQSPASSLASSTIGPTTTTAASTRCPNRSST